MLRLVVPATAAVDGSGRYDEFADAQTMELPFRFTEEGGEWRISQAPDGTIFAAAIFDRLFAKRSLYFYDPTFTYLVPDVRWDLNLPEDQVIARTDPDAFAPVAIAGSQRGDIGVARITGTVGDQLTAVWA